MKVPGSRSEPDDVEVLEYRAYRLKVQKVSDGWVSSIARHGDRPTIILDPCRDDAIARARECVDGQVQVESPK